MKPIIRKGIQDIRTVVSLQMFRSRTPAGAMAELTALSVVKERLKAEIQKLESRYTILKELTKKIEEKERFLYRFVDAPKGNLSPEKVESHGNGSLREKEQKNPAPPSNINEIIIKY